MKIIAFASLLSAATAWPITYRDTTLSGTINGPVVLAGEITVPASLTFATLVDLLPGTTLRLARGGSVTLRNVTALGTAKDSIRILPMDPAVAWSNLVLETGNMEYCAIAGGSGGLTIKRDVFLSRSSISAAPGESRFTLQFSDGVLYAKSVVFRGKSVYISSGSGADFYNSYFPDSTRFHASSIQNNYSAGGNFLNCTFARGARFDAHSAAALAVWFSLENSVFGDPLDSIRGDKTNKVGLTRCMGGAALFQDADAGNYRLRRGSAAIDTGSADPLHAAPATDLDGNPRVIGKAVDLGAFEFDPEAVVHLRLPPATGKRPLGGRKASPSGIWEARNLLGRQLPVRPSP